jgi:pimeloyl-ACP methyl ester carboxylesterase
MQEMRVAGRQLDTIWIPAAVAGRPAIVMLHEGLGSIALWKDFPQQVASRTGCGVFVYSRYGHGNSSRLEEKRPVDHLHTEAELVLPEILSQAGITRPILLGHSDGAAIALIYAGKYPDAAAGLILEAPHVFVEDLSVRSIAETRNAFLNGDLRRKLARYQADVDSTFWGWADIWLSPEFRTWNIESYLAAIRCPVLMIQGEDDEYGTTAQLDAIQSKVPHSEILLMPACGHSPHRDRTEDTLSRIAAFISAHVPVGQASRPVSF